MDLIVLIPFFACLVVLATRSARHAFAYVYLPTVMLLPGYWTLRLPHIPPVSFTDVVILPLGLALLYTEIRRWRFDWMDLWVFLFAVSAGMSEGLSAELAYGTWTRLFTADSAASGALSYNINNGIYAFFGRINSVILPYVLGKLIIEHGELNGQPMRKVMIRRMVTFLSIVTGISVIDFLTGRSTWQRVFRRFFAGQMVDFPEMVRWGFGRIAGPFGHAILAGMVFLTGVVYCLWLLWVDREWGSRPFMRAFPLKMRTIALLAVVGGLLMTQSRGPWIGVILALIFASLVRLMSAEKAAVVFLVLVMGLGSFVYIVGKKYTQGTREMASSESQASAIYRRQLLQTYIPVVRERPGFGWGFTDYPGPNGQKSIDNQFLWVAVTQGFFGLGIFFLIALGSAFRLLKYVGLPLVPEDRLLIFAHIAVLMGLLTSLATVYMGGEVMVVYFMVIGWVQGMRPRLAVAGAPGALGRPLRFRKVLT
jgi:hypothetical protein